MAEKKKGKRGDRSDKGRTGEELAGDRPPMSDRRATEGISREVLPDLGWEGSKPATDLDRAQEVMYEAFEAEGPQKVRLARKALTISADCADAYVLLAEHASRLDDALRLYEQGLAAAERALGQQAVQEYQGRFWGVLETRPYMRARLGLAQCLWESGRREDAVGHYRDMLRLNPDDNQGIRYVLAACLLNLDQYEELARLLADYHDDDSANWAYSKVLLAYRKEGDSERARKLASRAAKRNPHVPAYLLGIKPMPRELPEYVARGGEDEAIGYTADFLSAWRATPGALGWLRKTLKVRIVPKRKERKPSWAEVRLALRRLPQERGDAPGELNER